LFELPERLWSGAQFDCSGHAEVIALRRGSARISTACERRQEINDNNSNNRSRRGSARG
jgi:hypothetical protein